MVRNCIGWKGVEKIGSSQKLFTGRLYILKGGVRNGFASDKDDIPSWFDVIQTQPYSFAHSASGPITLHGIPYALAGGKAKTTIGQIVREDDQYNQGMFVTPALATDLLKAIFGSQTVTSTHK